MAKHDLYEHRILQKLQAGDRVTQRSLSRELGIALGLTNLLLRRLVTKGWVRISRVKPSRLHYVVTPAGIAAKARLSRAYVRESIRFYCETRDRIRDELSFIAKELDDSTGRTPVVFYGGGEAAEIAYLCLRDTQLELIAVVDPLMSRSFFDAPVLRPDDLRDDTVAGRPFGKMIVMPVENEDEVRAILAARGVTPASVAWL